MAHKSEQRWLVTHRAQVGQTISAIGEHHRQIAHHPTRIVFAPPLAHRRQRTHYPACTFKVILTSSDFGPRQAEEVPAQTDSSTESPGNSRTGLPPLAATSLRVRGLRGRGTEMRRWWRAGIGLAHGRMIVS